MNQQFRHEIKFCCRLDELHHCQRWLAKSDAGFRQAYEDRFINNIYFDGFHWPDASNNLIGLSQREKLRLRWYGDVDEINTKQLERKIRQGGLGRKIITPLQPFSLHNYSKQQLTQAITRHRLDSTFVPAQTLTDIRLRNPVLRNRYKRAYFQEHSNRLRITIDTHQVFYSVDQQLSVLTGNRIDYPLVVIEAKFADTDHRFARHLLDRFPLRPVRHSKYLAGLARLIEQPYF